LNSKNKDTMALYVQIKRNTTLTRKPNYMKGKKTNQNSTRIQKLTPDQSWIQLLRQDAGSYI